METSNGQAISTFYESEETQAPSEWAILKWKTVRGNKDRIAVARVTIVNKGGMEMLRAEFPGYEGEPMDLSYTEFGSIWWVKEARAEDWLRRHRAMGATMTPPMERSEA